MLYVNRRHPNLQESLSANFDEFVERHTTEIQLIRNRPYLRRLENILSDGPASIIVKHYNTSSSRLGHCEWFRGQQAVREFKRDCAVYQAGVSTAEPLAAMTRPVSGGHESFLLTAELMECINVRDLLMIQFCPFATPTERRVFIQQLSEFVADGHARGLQHNDLNGTNIIARCDEHEHWHFWFIDLAHAKLRRHIPTRGRIKDIARLYQSLGTLIQNKEALAFWTVYTRTHPYMQRHQHVLIPRILKRLQNRQGQLVFVQQDAPLPDR